MSDAVPSTPASLADLQAESAHVDSSGAYGLFVEVEPPRPRVAHVERPTIAALQVDAAHAVVCVRGATSLGTLPELEAVVREVATSTGEVLVDLAECEHLDFGALQLLLALRLECRRQGRAVRVVGVPEPVRQLAGAAGLAAVLQDDPFTLDLVTA